MLITLFTQLIPFIEVQLGSSERIHAIHQMHVNLLFWKPAKELVVYLNTEKKIVFALWTMYVQLDTVFNWAVSELETI